MLLRGQRCKTAKQMKTYVHDYVGMHLLGSPGYKSIEEVVEKLESPLITDPKSPRRKAATRLLSSPPLTPAGTLPPPIGIIQSDDPSTIIASSHIQTGINSFSSEVGKR